MSALIIAFVLFRPVHNFKDPYCTIIAKTEMMWKKRE